MSNALKRIQKSGYVSRMKADANIGIAETWHACIESGSLAHYGNSLNAQECRGLVCAGALRRVRVIGMTGAVIYQLQTA